jgi:hypothetical protein
VKPIEVEVATPAPPFAAPTITTRTSPADAGLTLPLLLPPHLFAVPRRTPLNLRVPSAPFRRLKICLRLNVFHWPSSPPNAMQRHLVLRSISPLLRFPIAAEVPGYQNEDLDDDGSDDDADYDPGVRTDGI